MNSIKKELKKVYLKIYYLIYCYCIYFYRSFFIPNKDRDYSIKKISLLCPSRQRVNKTKRFLDSIYEKTENINNIEILFLLDEDEKFYSEYKELISKYNIKGNIISIFRKSLLTNSDRMNYLASVSKGEILLVTNDDMCFLTSGWDTLLNDEFSKSRKKEPLSVWLRCDRKYTYLDCSAFPAINRSWYDKIGYLSYYKFRNWYLDTWICDIGRKTGLLLVSNKIKIKQFHALSIIDEIDDTHRKNHTKENIYYDDQIWLDTIEVRKIDAEKLKKQTTY